MYPKAVDKFPNPSPVVRNLGTCLLFHGLGLDPFPRALPRDNKIGNDEMVQAGKRLKKRPTAALGKGKDNCLDAAVDRFHQISTLFPARAREKVWKKETDRESIRLLISSTDPFFFPFFPTLGARERRVLRQRKRRETIG